MTPPGVRPALAAGWPDALKRGSVAFLAVAGLGQILALAVWALGGTGRSFATFARMGWMYFATFHHVALRFDVDPFRLGMPEAAPQTGSASVSLGVTFLAATGFALWLLYRGGRASADRVRGGTAMRLVQGAKLAPAYAAPGFALSLLIDARVRVDTAVAAADVRVSLDPWQTLAFPLVLAGLAGAAGGLRSALEARPSDLRAVGAAAAGGWRMFVLGLALAYGGLFVAGVLQPDEPAALLTPSSARYYQEAFDRPWLGSLVLAHHVGLSPNEAVWALVPAMGACDGVRGTLRADLLCYGRFPSSLGLLGRGEFPLLDVGDLRSGPAPPAYLLFLLVPAVATFAGGRRSVQHAGVPRARAVTLGVLSGAIFSALVLAGGVLASGTLGYQVEIGGEVHRGWLLIGPNLVTGPLLALGWGIVGGAVGAISTRPRATEPSPGSPPPGAGPR